MPKIQKVTVALSMCESDVDLLRYADMIAGLGAVNELRFVHVVTPAHKPAHSDAISAMHDRLASQVAKHFRFPSADVAVSYDVLEGIRIDSLVEFVIEHESDLILLGHRKERSGRRSLARRLAMITPCSVWMVPEGSPARISTILAPVDFSDHSADSLSQATAIARLHGLEECLALHVFFDPSTVRYDEHLDEVRGNEQREFAEFRKKVNTHNLTVEPLFEESTNVARAILRSAEKHNVDLIVMSTRGRSRAASILLGSATSQVMTESRVPVLAVKHYGAQMNLFQALRASHFWERPNPKMN